MTKALERAIRERELMQGADRGTADSSHHLLVPVVLGAAVVVVGVVLWSLAGSDSRRAASGPAPPASVAVSEAPLARPEDVVYEVRPGDTLSKIAKAFDVSVEDIRRSNDLTGDLIFPRQRLRIVPRDAASGDGHIAAAPPARTPSR